MPNKQKLVDDFHKETGKYYYDTSALDFAWSDDYVRWLENRLELLKQYDLDTILKSFIGYAKSSSISDININDDTVFYFLEKLNKDYENN